MRTVFVNPDHCIGCRQCEFACALEHSQSKEPAQAILERPLPRPRVHVEAGPSFNSSFPNRCRHCDPAPCMQVCPTAAIYRDGDLGLVLIQAHKCIACAMCAMVCPFDALTFHAQVDGRIGDETRVMAMKCDGCIDRLTVGLEPACVETCKVGALVFGELNELVREGRARTAAAAVQAEVLTEAEFVDAWREWGENVNKLEVVT